MYLQVKKKQKKNHYHTYKHPFIVLIVQCRQKLELTVKKIKINLQGELNRNPLIFYSYGNRKLTQLKTLTH